MDKRTKILEDLKRAEELGDVTAHGKAMQSWLQYQRELRDFAVRSSEYSPKPRLVPRPKD